MLSLTERLFHENDLLRKQVSDENDSLHRQVGELTTKLNVANHNWLHGHQHPHTTIIQLQVGMKKHTPE